MRRRAIIGAIMCVVVLVGTGLLLAQPQRGGRQREGAEGQPGARQRGEGQDAAGRQGMGGMRDPEQMRQMMNERMRQQLGASEAEWKLIGPRLQKVMELNRDATAGGRGMFGVGGMGGMGMAAGGRPGGPGEAGAGRPGAPGAQRELSAVDKATEQLQTVLAKESPSADEIKTALTSLRTAREKAKQDLAKAQQELRQLLSVKQEAMLVLMGTLN